MKKYYLVFKNEFHKKLEYKFDFFLSRLRSIVMFLILYFLWVSAASQRSFAGYSKTELVTYVFGTVIVGAIVFGVQSKHMGFEINSGYISSVLIKPINYFWYIFVKQLSERVISFVLSILELSVLFLFLRFEIVLQTDPILISGFFVSLILAMFLFHTMEFIVSTMAFWSREAFGPKWLFEWVAIFASGQFFPLNILATPLYVFLSALPFAFVLYFPLIIYLGKISPDAIVIGIITQVVWLIIAALTAHMLWKKGLKKFTGEGL